jgi:hypothetical protein
MTLRDLPGLLTLLCGLTLTPIGAPADDAEDAARGDLERLYKGDYRAAFVEKRPELFLKHIADDFRSTSVEGMVFDAKALREFFPGMFSSMLRTVEHNVTIEDVDILPNGNIATIVTLYTLIEFRRATGQGSYFVTTIATYRDEFRKTGGVLYSVSGDQLRNQVITAPRP